jgi:hypothetical protein
MPNVAGMTFRRILIIVVLCVVGLPQVAQAREPGATWESETAGLPASTLQGQWVESDDGRSLELVFVGGHLIQSDTTFSATWLTPFTTKGKRPRFEHSYEIENGNSLGKDIKLVQSFRFRSKGEKWWPWMSYEQRLKPGWSFLSGGSIFGGGSKRPVQFEWRLSGTIEAPTYLRGSATFSIN